MHNKNKNGLWANASEVPKGPLRLKTGVSWIKRWWVIETEASATIEQLLSTMLRIPRARGLRCKRKRHYVMIFEESH